MSALRPTLCLVASAAALAALPVAAQTTTATQTFPVTGNAPQVCALQRGQVQPGGLVNINGIDGDTLRILQLTDPQTLAAKAASATISFSGFCNFPHRVRIESTNNGLWPTDGRIGPSSNTFASAVPYRASMAWGVASGALSADATVRQINAGQWDVNQPTAGDMTLRIEIQQGASNVEVNAPVLAGAYGDTLRIFLEPR